MAERVPEIALRIVTGLHAARPGPADEDRQEMYTAMEAVRIAALTGAMRQREERPCDRPPREFVRLSRMAQMAGVRSQAVLSLAAQLLGSVPFAKIAERVRKLSPREFTYLLGTLHYYGTHILPHGDARPQTLKGLGSFYTPPHVADFIVQLTIAPLWSRQAPQIITGDQEALQHILSLRVLDPACGPGAFLVSVLEQFIDWLKSLCDEPTVRTLVDEMGGVSVVAGRLARRLYGVDLDLGALEVAAQSLSILTSRSVTADEILTRTLRQGDALISRHGLDGERDYSHLLSDDDDWVPFEWREEFPDVLRDGDGFDVIVMNPPYERLRPNVAEFLRERLALRRATRGGPEFREHRERLFRLVRYFRRSGDYRFTNRYTIDTHRLFIERSLRLLRNGGRLGVVVPTSILGDLSARPLREHLLLENRVETIIEFPERARLFPDVTQGVTVLVVEKGNTTETLEVYCGLENTRQHNEVRPLRLSVEDIFRVTGKSLKVPCVAPNSWATVLTIHRQPPMRSLHGLRVLRGELDLTLDREFITRTPTGTPLVRGSAIERFVLRPPDDDKSEWVLLQDFVASRSASSRTSDISRVRIACQQVSNRSQRWRLKFALVPTGCVLANSVNYVTVSNDNEATLLYLLGVLNSTLLNWRFKMTSTNNHVSIAELQDLPLVPLDGGKDRTRELAQRLIAEVRTLLSAPGRPIHTLDAVVFALYGLDDRQARDVLECEGATEEETEAVMNELRGLV